MSGSRWPARPACVTSETYEPRLRCRRPVRRALYTPARHPASADTGRSSAPEYVRLNRPREVWREHPDNRCGFGRLPGDRRNHRWRCGSRAHAVGGAGQRCAAFRGRCGHGRRGHRGAAGPAGAGPAVADHSRVQCGGRAAGRIPPVRRPRTARRGRGRPRRRPCGRSSAGGFSRRGRRRPVHRRAAGGDGRDRLPAHRDHHHHRADRRGAVFGGVGGAAADPLRSTQGPGPPRSPAASAWRPPWAACRVRWCSPTREVPC